MDAGMLHESIYVQINVYVCSSGHINKAEPYHIALEKFPPLQLPWNPKEVLEYDTCKDGPRINQNQIALLRERDVTEWTAFPGLLHWIHSTQNHYIQTKLNTVTKEKQNLFS